MPLFVRAGERTNFYQLDGTGATINVAHPGGVLFGETLGYGLPGVFGSVAVGFVAYGAIMAASVRAGVWR